MPTLPVAACNLGTTKQLVDFSDLNLLTRTLFSYLLLQSYNKVTHENYLLALF